MASSLPAKSKSSLDFDICSDVGFTTNFPSIKPTRTPAAGLIKGMSDITSAAAAPHSAKGSGRGPPWPLGGLEQAQEDRQRDGQYLRPKQVML